MKYFIFADLKFEEGFFSSNHKKRLIKLDQIDDDQSICFVIPNEVLKHTYHESSIKNKQNLYNYSYGSSNEPERFTKKAGEDLISHWSKVYKIPFISLRLFNVYGTRSRTSGTYGAVFGVFLAQKLSKKPFTIVGSGKQKRDFTYVSDVVKAMIKASKSRIKNEILNVGSGSTVSILKIAKLLGGKKVFIRKRPGEPDITFADISKIKKKLNWKPNIKIEQGVSFLLDNIDYWKNAPVWTPKKITKVTKLWFKYLG